MKKSEHYFENKKEFLSPEEYRTYNRYYLHPRNKRLCNKCFIIYEDIPSNFHVKRYYNEKSSVSYNCFCKSCASIKNLSHRLKIREDPNSYIKASIASFKGRAKEQGCEFNLTPEYLIDLFFNVQNQLCYYTKEPLSFNYYVSNRNHPHRKMCSLDRRTPAAGYVEGNVVWTLYEINRQKNDSTEEEFYKICKMVVDNIPA